MDQASRTARARFRCALAALLAVAAALALGAAPASAKVPGDFFGISATVPTEGDYSRMGEAGFGAFRFDLNWSFVQRTRKGAFDWNGPDAIFRAAAASGMRPTPILLGTPRFVKKNADGLYPPTESKADREAWKRFVATAAQRYGRGGIFWQENPGLPELPFKRLLVWNEENANAFWKPKPNPRDYATLVQITDQAVKDAGVKADIVLGGMFGYPRSDSSYSAVSFLKRFYKAPGIEKHFETIGVHPYGAGVGTVRKQIEQARGAAKKAGDGNVGILVGEIGWASTGPKSAEEVVGAKGQATRLRKGLKLLVDKRRAWNLEGAFVYVWRDFPPEFTACLWCPTAGLLEIGGKAKPALDAVRKVIGANR